MLLGASPQHQYVVLWLLLQALHSVLELLEDCPGGVVQAAPGAGQVYRTVAPLEQLDAEAFIAVALFTLLAVISPGADFAMVTRSSYAQGRAAGLAAAVGIGLGVHVHVLYTVLGVAVIISHSHGLFMLMKALGAGYLIYLGYQSMTSKGRIQLDDRKPSTAQLCQALRVGFMTNALNPKTVLFVVSAYTQVVQPGSSLALDFAYGGFMSVAH